MYQIILEIPSAAEFERCLSALRQFGLIQYMISSQKLTPAQEQGQEEYKTPNAFLRGGNDKVW